MFLHGLVMTTPPGRLPYLETLIVPLARLKSRNARSRVSAELLKLAEGKSEAEIFELDDLKELKASDTQYSYTLGAGPIALMKQASVWSPMTSR
jgi:hypothetical protein